MADNNNAKRLFYILELLWKETDENHTLSQQDIIERLEAKGIHANRKTVKSNIVTLKELGFDIKFYEAERSKGTSKENTFTSRYYMVNDFDDSELRLLIDSVLYSPNISAGQGKHIVDKLCDQSSKYFNFRAKHISTIQDRKKNNPGLVMALEEIDSAIAQNKKIEYKKVIYDVKEGYQLKKSNNGKDQRYKISPYHVVMSEGKYYLIGGANNSIIHLDLNRIREVKVYDEEAIPFTKFKESNGIPFNLKEYMDHHIFMGEGEPIRVQFKIIRTLLYDLVDTFGEKDITIIRNDGDTLDISVRTSEKSIEQFLRRYSPQVTIVEPAELKDKFATMFAAATIATKNGYRIKKKSDADKT